MSIATGPALAGSQSDYDPRVSCPRTIADLLKELGDIRSHRVRLVPAPGSATEADVILATHTKRLCELVEGTLVEKPMGVHERYFAALISMYLNNFVITRRLGIVCAPDGMFRMLKGNVREPDVSFTRRARLPNPLPQVGGWCPDLCIEVLSPDNTAKEMDKKRREYFGAGCSIAWELDHRKRIAAVYTSAESCRRLTETDTLDGGEVLPGFTLSLAELFAAFDDGMQPSP